MLGTRKIKHFMQPNHLRRISELETDKFLGSLYLYELIDKSKKLEHLQAIRGYLDTEEKTTNIPNEE